MRRLAPILSLLLALSACKVGIELDTTIEEDGSGRVSFAVGFDDDFRQAIETFSELGGEESPGDLFEQIEGEAPPGWEVERFSDDELEGVRISREFSDLDDLRAAFEETQAFSESDDELTSEAPAPTLGDEFSIERDGDVITIELGAPEGMTPTTGTDDIFGDENPFEDLEFELVVRFTLPGAIEEHNADEVDGNTLIWRFDQDSDPTPIRAVADASKSSGGSDFPVGALIAVVVVAAGAVGLFLWSRNRATSAAAGGTPPPGEPPPPPPPPPGDTPPPPPAPPPGS